MNISLTKIFVFSAAHRLHSRQLNEEENREVYTKCNNEFGHGHDYILEVTVKGKPHTQTGKIILNREFDTAVNSVIGILDHKHLDKEIPFFKENISTGEILIQYLWGKIDKKLPDNLLYYLKLWETNNNYFEMGRDK